MLDTIQPANETVKVAEAVPQNSDIPRKDATQRVRLEDADIASKRPATARRSTGNTKKRKARFNRRDKITLITLSSITAVLLIVAIIALTSLFAAPADDGLILKGVVAAGVKLGGLTPTQAATVLKEATADTYTRLDMKVAVLDTEISLPPSRTGAKLDIQAVVDAAYNYGRTGSYSEREQARKDALANSAIIPIIPYLNLDKDYIREEINKLGSQFSSTLTQPSITVTGTKPSMDVTAPNTDTVHQTLSIYVGTAEYGLDTNKLYEQVLEYYNINIFHVVGACTVVAPDSIEEDLLAKYNELCVEPIDAQIDPATYVVTPEVYGYGFNLDEVKDQIASAVYGTTLEIPLRYLMPNLTAELISSNLFKDVIGDFTSSLGTDAAWNHNATLACEKLNGLILKSGDVFSLNELLGDITAEKGYQNALAYIGKNQSMVLGGGISHVASVLYNSVLEAELEVLERQTHTYAPSFVEAGRDVYFYQGRADFRFRNSGADPIRIDAAVVDNSIQISIVGADNRDYRVEVHTFVKKINTPGKLCNFMRPNNPGGYKDGDELVPGMNGYEIEVYRSIYSKKSNKLQKEELIATCKYDSRDSVVVSIQQKEEPPTEPPETSGSTESSSPSNPTTGTEGSGPAESEPGTSEPTASGAAKI